MDNINAEVEELREYRRSVLKELGEKILENFEYRCDSLPSYQKEKITFSTNSGPMTGYVNTFCPVYTFGAAISQFSYAESTREKLKLDEDAKFVIVRKNQYRDIEKDTETIKNADKNGYYISLKIWHGHGLDKMEVAGDNNSPYLISEFSKEDAKRIVKACENGQQKTPDFCSISTKFGEVIFSEKDIEIVNGKLKIINDELVSLLNELKKTKIQEPTKSLLSSKGFINQVKALLNKDNYYEKLAEEKIKEQEKTIQILENNIRSLKELGSTEAAKQCLEEKILAEKTLEAYRSNPEDLIETLKALDLAQKNEKNVSSGREEM